MSELKISESFPKPGFYYHYKHDPAGPVNEYAYEVINGGFHTEDDCRPVDAQLVVFRPLYESSVYKAGKYLDVRPLSLFNERAIKDGASVPRYQLITDQATINALIQIRAKMYEW